MLLVSPCWIWPPTVLYWPLTLIPVVRWTTIVTESAVRLPVLVTRTCCSLYQGLVSADHRRDGDRAAVAPAGVALAWLENGLSPLALTAVTT